MIWQPIATAPKQSKTATPGDIQAEYLVLVFDPDNKKIDRVQLAFWNNVLDDWQSVDDTTELFEPTHWMPLPSPPEAKT